MAKGYIICIQEHDFHHIRKKKKKKNQTCCNLLWISSILIYIQYLPHQKIRSLSRRHFNIFNSLVRPKMTCALTLIFTDAFFSLWPGEGATSSDKSFCQDNLVCSFLVKNKSCKNFRQCRLTSCHHGDT